MLILMYRDMWPYLVVIALIIIAIPVYLVWSERSEGRKRAEMRRHIRMICDPNGCADADARLKRCFKLRELGIHLEDAGFKEGGDELCRRTLVSIENAARRNMSAKAELRWQSTNY